MVSLFTLGKYVCLLCKVSEYLSMEGCMTEDNELFLPHLFQIKKEAEMQLKKGSSQRRKSLGPLEKREE